MDYTQQKIATLVGAAIATGAGVTVTPRSVYKTFQANGTTSAGAGAATIKVQGSLDNSTWIDLGTITLTLATTVSGDGFVNVAPWLYVRGNVTAISGTDATVNLYMGQ